MLLLMTGIQIICNTIGAFLEMLMGVTNSGVIQGKEKTRNKIVLGVFV